MLIVEPSARLHSPVLILKGHIVFSRQSRLIESIRSMSLPFSIVDLGVYTYVLLVGAFQFTHYTRFADFVADTTYPDLARSILEQNSYQIRFLSQTTLPPGFPLILALAGRLVGFTPAVLFHVIAACATLGLIAAYELLRRVEGRFVAATACLLFGSSPTLFGFNTSVIFPEMPYFLASMLALLLALCIDRAQPGKALITWEVLLGVIIALGVLIRSVGIALLIGLCTWSVVSLLFVPDAGKRRIRRFAMPLLIGLAAQMSWSLWAQRHQTLEWQLPGYPQSYMSQLRVKNGQYPELGMAHFGDIPRRIGQNTLTRAAGLDRLLIRRYISNFWSSPAIFGVLVLIILGVTSSFRDGGQLHDWYFLWYESIFLLWPWDYRDRFLFPVVPLACLYLWRGARFIKNYSIRQPKTAGLGFVLFGTFLSLSSATFALRITNLTVDMQHVRGDRLQPFAAIFFWGLLAVVGFGILHLHHRRDSANGARAFARFSEIVESETSLPLRFIAILTVAFLVVSGTEKILLAGRDNLKPDITENEFYPDIEAAEWVRTHEAPDRVVMAREPDFVYHYTHRRVVWFPPISNAKVLMDGIRRYHVQVLVVAHHSESYWLPAEDACFQFLLQAYPTAFHVVHQGPHNQVFEVDAPHDGT